MRHHNAIPRNEREAYAKERALAALARSRREGLTPSVAARAEGTTLNTMRRYVGTALQQKSPGGRWRVTASDRIARTLNFLTERGPVAITVRDSRLASQIGEHANAVKVYRNTGDTSTLAPFRGKSFRAGGLTHRFITDPEILDKLADAGVLEIEGLYRAVHGAR